MTFVNYTVAVKFKLFSWTSKTQQYYRSIGNIAHLRHTYMFLSTAKEWTRFDSFTGFFVTSTDTEVYYSASSGYMNYAGSFGSDIWHLCCFAPGYFVPVSGTVSQCLFQDQKYSGIDGTEEIDPYFHNSQTFYLNFVFCI